MLGELQFIKTLKSGSDEVLYPKRDYALKRDNAFDVRRRIEENVEMLAALEFHDQSGGYADLVRSISNNRGELTALLEAAVSDDALLTHGFSSRECVVIPLSFGKSYELCMTVAFTITSPPSNGGRQVTHYILRGAVVNEFNFEGLASDMTVGFRAEEAEGACWSLQRKASVRSTLRCDTITLDLLTAGPVARRSGLDRGTAVAALDHIRHLGVL